MNLFAIKLFRKCIIFLCILSWLSSCDFNKEREKEQIPAEPSLTYTVEPAPEWTSVFKRDSGWFGGDGIFAIPYSGDDTENDSILFLFSDTMVGEINDGTLETGYVMVHNSVAFYEKGKAPSTTTFYVAEESDGTSGTLFIPNSQTDEYYWLGDGIVNAGNGNLYIFAYRIRDLHNGSQFPFEETGNDLLVIEQKHELPLKVTRTLSVPYSEAIGTNPPISFGSGLFAEGDMLYIYGVRGANKELVVARTTLEELEDFSSWEFKAANGWTQNRSEIHPIAEEVSNELSVSKLLDGQYALIYQGGGIYPKIYMELSDTPYGPFGEKQKIWDTSTEITDPDLFTYNAKAHPAISKPGELLVSYNVNSSKFFDIIENKPNLYRPRFFRIKFNSAK